MLSSYVDEHCKESMEQRDKDRAEFLKNFQNLLLRYDHIILFNHVGPDGDCLGCSFGMKEIINTNFPEKKAYVVGSNFGLYPWLHMKFDNLINYDFDFSNALALIMDVGQSQRIQLFDKFFKNSKVKFGAVVKIDHHGSPSDFHLDLSWDDPTYVASCCQIIQIADFYGWKLTPKAATFLYLGVCTDSLRFSTDSVLPRSLILAAKAWRAGADYINIHRRLNARTWKEIEIGNYFLNKAQKTENIIYCVITKPEMEKFHITHAKGIVAIFQNIEAHWIWMLFIEASDNTYDVDIRSVHVSARDLALKYGGGGHENAAGCKIPRTKMQAMVDDAETIVQDAKKQMNHDMILKDEPDEELEYQKSQILNQAPSATKQAKDTLRDFKKLKENNWSE